MNNYLTSLFLSTLLGATVFQASPANSASYGQNVRYVEDIEYRVEARFQDSRNIYTINGANENEIKPVIKNVAGLTEQLMDMRWELRNKLYSEINDAARDQDGKVTSYNFSMGEFPEKVSLEFEGTKPGVIKTKVGPIQLDFSAVAKRNKWGGNLWTVKVNSNIKPFYIVGDYEINSGKLVRPRLVDYDFDVDIDTTSGIVILNPILHFLSGFSELLVKQELAEAISNYSSAEYMLFDIEKALQSNKYVAAAGVDIADDVKTLLSDAVQGQRLKFDVARTIQHYPVGDGTNGLFYSHRLIVEMGSKHKIMFWDSPIYGTTKATACNWGVCFAPNSTMDKSNTPDWINTPVIEAINIPSGSSCKWRSTPSYTSGGFGSTYSEYPAIGACKHSRKTVTKDSYGKVKVNYI